jgi:two-component system sensor histidine kinase KdpD
MKLAESLGAETQTLRVGLARRTPSFCQIRERNQIVVGRAPGGIVSELLRRSLPHELVRRTQDIAIHLITREADGAVKPVSRSPRWFRKS